MSNRTSKLKHEILVPGDTAWELWSGGLTTPLQRLRTYDEHVPGAFESSSARRVLALPASALWVLPAWLKGEAQHLRDVAQLHLERLNVRVPAHERSLAVESLESKDGSHLARIIALKDLPTPLASMKLLPDECRIGALCYPLPADCITVWRELGRLVVAITAGSKLVYFSPMSAAALDQHGIAELNNICLQLSFQKVLGSLGAIVLWMEDGDVERLHKATGLLVRRQDKPVPRLVAGTSGELMPVDVIATREAAQASVKRRVLGLGMAFVVAAVVAGFSVLMSMATRERDALREQVAELTPKASRVGNQQAAWMEAAPAVDPAYFPMDQLLRCMAPSSVKDVAFMSFEATLDKIMIQARTPEIAPALAYTQDIKTNPDLAAYRWDAETPHIEADNSATFTLKGTLPGKEGDRP